MPKPAFWRFLPHATACVAADQLILLDVRQDRYLQVTGTTADAMRQWLLTGGAAALPDPVRLMLERNGITRTADPAPSIAAAESLEIPETLISPTWLDAPPRSANPLVVAAVVLRTRRILRRVPLQTILGARATAPGGAGGKDELVARCAAFDRARSLTPVPRRCLLDSLALSAWLAPQGISARLVFGVTARPFSAHCWLQVPETLLNDSYDHVSRFTPILVA